MLEKDSALSPCVDAAFTAITESGELEALTAEWLADNTGASYITLD